MKARVTRIGRYWIDQALLDEGYRPEDLFGSDGPAIELPELIDPQRRHSVRWLLCPRCKSCSQVGLGWPSCELCGWNQE